MVGLSTLNAKKDAKHYGEKAVSGLLDREGGFHILIRREI